MKTKKRSMHMQGTGLTHMLKEEAQLVIGGFSISNAQWICAGIGVNVIAIGSAIAMCLTEGKPKYAACQKVAEGAFVGTFVICDVALLSIGVTAIVKQLNKKVPAVWARLHNKATPSG